MFEPNTLPIRIAGMGHYLPPQIITSAELELHYNVPEGWIERTTGVRERRYVTNETSAQMGAWAALQALEQAQVQASEIDLIIGASAAPQQGVPCTAAFVQRELGIEGIGAPCFDINATCLSFLFALQTAAHYIEAGLYRNILIFSSEIASKGLNWKERESAALFGDGAAAAIVQRAKSDDNSLFWGAEFKTDSRGAELTQFEGAGTLNPPNGPHTTPEMNTFSMQGPAIFKMATRMMPPMVDKFLEKIGWERGSISAVVPHQASLYAIRQLTRRFGFEDDQIVMNLPARGNCVAASIPLALSEAISSGRIVRGDRVLLLGTGAGLSLGVTAITF